MTDPLAGCRWTSTKRRNVQLRKVSVICRASPSEKYSQESGFSSTPCNTPKGRTLTDNDSHETNKPACPLLATDYSPLTLIQSSRASMKRTNSLSPSSWWKQAPQVLFSLRTERDGPDRAGHTPLCAEARSLSRRASRACSFRNGRKWGNHSKISALECPRSSFSSPCRYFHGNGSACRFDAGTNNNDIMTGMFHVDRSK